MKTVLLLFILLVFGYQIGFSQCTPVQFPGPNVMSPDSNQGVKPVIATYLYNQVINVRVPVDTVIPPAVFPIPIDSAGVITITGLPTGLSYVTNSASDFWAGGTYGCVLIQGTVPQSEIGSYRATVSGVIYILGNAVPFDYSYNVEVIDSINQGFENGSINDFRVGQNSPNPVSTIAKIKFNSPYSDNYQFEVFDMIGNKVISKSLSTVSGVNTYSFNRGQLRSGIYFYRISNSEYSAVRRMIIN